MISTYYQAALRKAETDLVLGAARLHLVSEDLGTSLLSLGLVDVLHEDTLVLEDVTLRLLVERVVTFVHKID